MYLNGAVFENYRNIDSFSFSFDPEINILYGKNAQGKTNVIEGIYLFGNGKSFRHVKEKDLIRYDCDHARIAISYTDSIRENRMQYRIFKDAPKEISKNGMKIGRMSGFIGNFKAVLFCPEHLSIVKNEPAERRSFLDGAISQFHRPYLAALMEYKKYWNKETHCLKIMKEVKTAFR
jgi:DNA replication and repair protein RecF